MKTNFLNMDGVESIVLNLQLFAGENPNMVTTIPGTEDNPAPNTVSAEMKVFYETALLQSAKPKLVHEQFATFEPIPAGKGKTIEFRRMDNLPKPTDENGNLLPLTEGVTPVSDTITIIPITATVEQYGRYVEHTDVFDLVSVDPVIGEIVKRQGIQAGLTRDTVARNALAETTNINWCAKVVNGVETATADSTALTMECKLTVKEIQKAVAKMKANNIEPIRDGSYVLILHPHVSFDLKNDPRFEEWHKYTDASALFNGEIGKIDNCRIVESTEALITKGGEDDPTGLAVYHCFMLGQGAFGMTDIGGKGIEVIIKPLGSSGTADPLNQRGTVGWKTNCASVLLSPEAVIDIMCCGTYSQEAVANG